MTPEYPIIEQGTEAPGLVGRSFGNNKTFASWNMFVDEVEHVPELAWPTSVNAFERMRTDSQIAGLLAGITLPIRRYNWMIDPADADESMARMIAEDLALPMIGDASSGEVVKSVSSFNHDDHLRHALLALVFGFMPTEIVGRIEDGVWRMSKLAPRLPRTISSIKVEPSGDLHGIQQINMMQEEYIPDDHLVYFAWDKEGAQWSGRSILRPLYRNWLIKDRLLRIDAMKHERNGMGVPIAKAPENASKAQMDALQNITQELKAGESAGTALPPGADVMLKGVQGSLPDTIASVRYHDESMAKALLMMFMSLGTSESGSRALGDSFIDYFTLAQDAVAYWYVSTMQRQFIERWMLWNVGEGASMPRLVFDNSQARALAVADLVSLIDAGAITVDADLEASIRESHKLPVRADREAPRGQPYGYDLELGILTVDERRAQLGLPPLPEGVGEQTVPQSQSVLEVETVEDIADVEQEAEAAEPVTAAKVSQIKKVWKRIKAAYTSDSDYEYADRLPKDRPVRRMLYEHEIQAATDFGKMDEQWNSALDTLLEDWSGIKEQQIESLLEQIEEADGDYEALAAIHTPSDLGKQNLLEAMNAYADASSNEAIKEAERQGVKLKKPAAKEYNLFFEARAAAITSLMNDAISQSAARTAVRMTSQYTETSVVVDQVRERLEALSDSYARDNLGSALSSAQNEARAATFGNTEEPVFFYSSELLDSNTCTPCSQIDGKKYGSLEEALQDYPEGGYNECVGGTRCRGMLVAVYEEAESGS